MCKLLTSRLWGEVFRSTADYFATGDSTRFQCNGVLTSFIQPRESDVSLRIPPSSFPFNCDAFLASAISFSITVLGASNYPLRSCGRRLSDLGKGEGRTFGPWEHNALLINVYARVRVFVVFA